MSEFDPENVLESLAKEFEHQGFQVRRETCFFADNGIAIGHSGFLRVHLYVTALGLSARVTEHGGRHWIFQCATIRELRQAASSALETDEVPPSALWVREESFIYHVWFMDPGVPEDDQDREWVACIAIRATSPAEAKSWGDHLARSRADRCGEVFVSSGVEPLAEIIRDLPVVNAGVIASDEYIGW